MEEQLHEAQGVYDEQQEEFQKVDQQKFTQISEVKTKNLALIEQVLQSIKAITIVAISDCPQVGEREAFLCRII